MQVSLFQVLKSPRGSTVRGYAIAMQQTPLKGYDSTLSLTHRYRVDHPPGFSRDV